ncbi:MAG: DUF4912 domain-containing protein [Helicobacteraceae bacterium]|jgi:hypothetical protein|nr:DUF4912 domain-containing protein [Helicobacteraceae bacterium]
MNENPLVKIPSPSVGSSDLSSTALATDIMEAMSRPDHSGANISLPDEYDDNKLVLLPVNAHTQHFYWEISNDEIERRIAHRECTVIIRLYYIVQGKRQEVESIYSTVAKGNYYSYHTPNTQEMEAALFVTDKDGERLILTSNRISTPSSGMHSSAWEIWMTKNGKQQKLESRQAEMTPQELTSPSSLDLVLQAERLKARVGDMFGSNLSSDSLSSWSLGGSDLSSGSLPKK